MDGDDLLGLVRQAVRQTFFDETIAVTRETSAADVDGWDSLAHVRLLMNIETLVGIDIPPDQADRLDSIGDLVDLLIRQSAGIS